MTIGIAAYGPRAGLAVMRAIAAVEAVGRGAIGGFASLVVIDEGNLHRFETQRGGTAALFADGAEKIPKFVAEARCAGMMSSGPNRPEPLSHFTPADPKFGLVTGHRFTNTIGSSGMILSEEVLAIMKAGASPRAAVNRVVTANSDIDAGIIALSVDGRLHAANTAYVARRPDASSARTGSRRLGAQVAVLLNAIVPQRCVALLAADVAMDTMCPSDRPDDWITIREGTPLRLGSYTAVEVSQDGVATAIILENSKFLDGHWSLGIGFEVPALRRLQPFGKILYEPYIVVERGFVAAIDGKRELSVPIRLHLDSPFS